MSVCIIYIYIHLPEHLVHSQTQYNMGWWAGQVLILLGPPTWLDSQYHNQLCITELVKYFYALCDILIKVCTVPVLYLLYFYDL